MWPVVAVAIQPSPCCAVLADTYKHTTSVVPGSTTHEASHLTICASIVLANDTTRCTIDSLDALPYQAQLILTPLYRIYFRFR